MPDPRFFREPEPQKAAELARTFGLDIVGDGDAVVTGVAPLHLAGSGDLSFVAAKSHVAEAQTSGASVLIATAQLAEQLPNTATRLISDAPQQTFAAVARSLYPEANGRSSGISDSAHVDPTAILGPGVTVEPGAAILEGAEIGRESVIGSNAVIGAGVVLGQGCRIGPGVSVECSVLGDRVRLFGGAVIGQAGFGYVPGPKGLEHIPQLGRVVLGDDVDIGANTTIDRGAGGDTVIGNGTKIDNQVQIGHNCKIGAHCVIVSQCGISGSVTIADGAQLGGKVGVADHLTIGVGARVAAGSGVMRDVEDGQTVGGYPAVPIREWHRLTIALSRMVKPKKS